MAWLRIDDGFVTNAKIVQLTDAQVQGVDAAALLLHQRP
jgi:hypothetical protein